MSFLFDLIPTLVVLGALILIHEWGHFLACRLSKVRVEKFSIGFGPEVLHFQGRKTRYVVSLFPLGGFVKPAGESVSEIEGREPEPGDYLAAPVLQRIFIVIAGVAMNYLLSFVLFVAILMMGRPVPMAQIGGFVEGYPARQSGLLVGDQITAIEGAPIASWEDLTDRLSRLESEEVDLEILRKNRLRNLRVPVRLERVRDIFGEEFEMARLGILPDLAAQKVERLGFFPALKGAGVTEVHLTGLTYKALFYLVTGRLSLKTVSGPIGIMSMTGTAAKKGLVYVLHLTAVLGISLAVINLLPIPALDGGHLVFLLIEWVIGRRVSLAFQERATQVGFAFLLALMAFVIYNDLLNLRDKGSGLHLTQVHKSQSEILNSQPPSNEDLTP